MGRHFSLFKKYTKQRDITPLTHSCHTFKSKHHSQDSEMFINLMLQGSTSVDGNRIFLAADG